MVRFGIVPNINGIVTRPVVAPRITATGPLIRRAKSERNDNEIQK
jgi:hypothetical protein